MRKLNKTGGVVTNTIMGVGALIIGVIITFVVVQTLIDADLFVEGRDSDTLLNQVLTVVNETGVVFGNSTLNDPSCAVDLVFNNTVAVPSSNFTVNAVTCTISFSGTENDALNNSVWTVNSTTTFDGDAEDSVNALRANFTDGIDNVSEKIPTILLIVAVVFLFGALVLLMRNAKALGVGGGGSL